ncbi:MAG: carboxypeptidase-like regulatory domain-containing protein [Terracidiphilus sp.]|nr:carboxypeptidase-like regulatory domain-containing protein [Terracidiphilus sp.]
MKRRAHFAGFAVLIALTCASVSLAAPVTVAGVVRNSSGVPQMGAQVDLLRSDLTVAATVITDSKGRFLIAAVVPGNYSIKAICASYLPTLRENVRVRTGTVVNLTLNTLYEAMQWFPAQPRGQDSHKDDWRWTLRSAANRPLLRMLEDGPLVVVENGKGSARKLKARLMATGQAGTFGESGERISTTLEDTPAGSRELLARVDFSPDSNAGMESMLGFRQDLGYAGSVQSVAAVSIQPAVEGPDGAGLNEWVMKTWETARLGDEFEVEAGATHALAKMQGAGAVAAVLPFAEVRWYGGKNTVSYRMNSMVPGVREDDDSAAGTWMPSLAVRKGRLTMTRGLHQQLGWERRTENSGLSVAVFADRIDNPMLEAAARFNAGESSQVRAEALLDRASNLIRTAGPNYASTGIEASLERRLPAGNLVRLSYANGDALVIPSLAGQIDMTELMAAARPRRAQTYTIALSGTLDGTGTRWRASYRWQPEDTVTAVAPYAVEASAPYFNLHLRQPIRLGRAGTSSFEALLDVQNLLAEGYRPYLMNDGSLLLFAQDQRGFRGGVAFSF